jgi:hypothetical protein
MHDHRVISLYDLIIIDKTKIKENGLDISAEINFNLFSNQNFLLKNFVLWFIG